jgi:plasmid replication initiation protein
MVGEITIDTQGNDASEQRSPLLPDRHPTSDFFICDIFDAAPKGDMTSMAHPIFSLSTKPDHRARRYEHQGNYLEVKPSADGLATVHDRDVLIYCISQLMAALNAGKKVEHTVRLKAYDLLTATNRVTDGRGYEGLKAALQRLQGTQIVTNIITGTDETTDIFSIIDRARIVRETRDGRMQEVEITLSDWVFDAIRASEVLTLHRDYFRLRKPLERRMYELARKHCGQQREWRISLDLLQKKTGSNSTAKEFRRLVKTIVEAEQRHGHMPDYALTMNDAGNVVFTAKQKPNTRQIEGHGFPTLRSATYERAREVAPGYDVYVLEQEWFSFWDDTGRPALKSPDAAFVSFCRKRHERRPNP